jgi:dephospho-CoA kinase
MIIGITGTDGAGKGAVVDYLVAQKGFTHYSGRA